MDRERGSLCPSGSHPRAGEPTGEGPAPIVGVAVRAARPERGRRGCTAALLAALILGSGALAGTSLPAGPAGAAATTTAAAGGPALVLEEQTATVTPSPGQSFDLHLRPGATTVPAAQLGLSITVYACLSSVSGFDQSVTSAAPSGPVISSTRTPLPLSGLPHLANGSVDLDMGVVVGTAPATATGFTIGLSSAGGQCGIFPAGVYPVRVQLVNTATGQTIGGFTTHLVYADAAADTQKLRIALVLPIRTTITPSTDPTAKELLARPSAALATPPAAAISAVTQTVGGLVAHAGVAVTLEASPQTIEALGSSSEPGAAAAVTSLGTLAATPQVHQFVRASFTPVNAAGLVGSGLSGELSLQVTRGNELLGATVRAAGSVGAPGAHDLWASNDGLDTAALTQLQADGYTRVVVPATGVSSPPTNGSAVEPFVLFSSRGAPMVAVASSADLAARFTGSPGNPVLAAHQLVAELAQIYYEKPNDTTVRAVVAMPPTSWTDSPSFVEALLTALAGNPIIQPVTVDTLFTTLPTAPCRTTCRSAVVNGGPPPPAGAIRTQRQRVDSFGTAAPEARPVVTQLGDLVLAAESEALRPAQQSAVLRNTGSALAAQLGQFTVAGDRTITLTSQQGTLPIDVVSTARYPVTTALTVTTDKLLFPNGSTQWTKPSTVQIRPGTNIIEVPFTVRSSGQFTVDVTIRAPTGALVLSHGEINVRSTATSVVGVVLTIGALMVLAVWWFRTSRKRRAARRRDEAGAPVSA